MSESTNPKRRAGQATSEMPTRVREASRVIIDSLGEIREALAEMVPDEVRAHRRNARKEHLLAWRGRIDARLAAIDRRGKPNA